MLPGITGSTRVCGVIGDPVAHTVSPAMHNAAFRALDLDYIYLPLRVSRPDLPQAVAGMRAFNIHGLNVTVPHKEKVLPLLDELDPLAVKIGAVNVIINNDGILKGYNTDAGGFLQALDHRGVKPDGKTAVVLGAGGASRAICFALAGQVSKILLLNRTAARAESLAKDVSMATGQAIEAGRLTRSGLSQALLEARLLVNTTSLGMSPNNGETPVTADLLYPGLTVVDIVYNPARTKLLQEAEKAGAATVNGLDMLVCQGAMAFHLWTGLEAPHDIMRKAAAGALKQHED